MKKSSLFDYNDYQQYLQDYLDLAPGRGARAELSDYLKCQRSFVSRVIQGKMHFSLEQAQKISVFCKHSQAETDFFLLLVQSGRAGTKALKDYFKSKIKEALHARLKYDQRLKSNQALSFEDQVRYFSSWHYAAIRVALGVPELKTAEALSRRLKLPLKTVHRILDFLESKNMVLKTGETYSGAPHHVHLGDDSVLIARSHVEWRMQAISALQNEGPRDLHFSNVITVSKEDAYKLQALLVKYIEELQAIVIPSQDETVAAICIDFFEL